MFTRKHFLRCKKPKNGEVFNISSFVYTVLLILSHFVSLTEPFSIWSCLTPLERFPNTSGLSLMEFIEDAVLSSMVHAEVTGAVAGITVGSGYPLQQSLWMLEGFPENQMCSVAWSGRYRLATPFSPSGNEGSFIKPNVNFSHKFSV